MKQNKSRVKIQRRLMTELPGLGKQNALERRPYPPGDHGGRRIKYSDYRLQLEEKQKIMYHYGVREKQLRRFIRDSKRGQGTNWTEKLIGRLERRIDNLVFRMNFAPSILAARQLVTHKKVLVNGKVLNVPSAILKPGDKVELKKVAQENQIFMMAQEQQRMQIADHLEVKDEAGGKVGYIKDIPGIDVVPFPFQAGLFTEYYSSRGV